MMKFAEQVKLNQGKNLIMTYHGQIVGIDFFAYIKCREDGVKLMHEDFASNTGRALEEYGEVIYRDNIAEPDEKACKFLQEYLAANGGEAM